MILMYCNCALYFILTKNPLDRLLLQTTIVYNPTDTKSSKKSYMLSMYISADLTPDFRVGG